MTEELTSHNRAQTDFHLVDGPALKAHALRGWREDSHITSTTANEAGSTWKNGAAESLKGQFRDQSLNIKLLKTAPKLLPIAKS